MMASLLQDTQIRKRFWEQRGVKFTISQSGASFDVSCAIDADTAALEQFVNGHRRALHALVVANGDQMMVNRFESVQWSRDHGRFTDELTKGDQ